MAGDRRNFLRRDFLTLSGAALLAATSRAGSVSRPRRVGIVGVPFNSAGLTGGVAHAPAALRAHGLVQHLSQVCDVRDYGDVAFAPPRAVRDAASGIKSLAATQSMVPAVQSAVARVLADGRFPLLLGGDCPVMLGALAAAHQRLGRVGLVFVDGHEDAYPPHASLSGEAADMEFGFAIGLYLEGTPKDFARRFPVVQPSDAVIIGARDAADIARDKVVSLASKVRVISDAGRKPWIARTSRAGNKPGWKRTEFPGSGCTPTSMFCRALPCRRSTTLNRAVFPGSNSPVWRAPSSPVLRRSGGTSRSTIRTLTRSKRTPPPSLNSLWRRFIPNPEIQS